MPTEEPTAAEAIAALERFVVENDELLQLEEQIGRFNIFDALGIARAEIRHSNFLAWLLDPSESHGQGPLFLRAILMDLLKTTREHGYTAPISPIQLDAAELRGVEIRREWNNIDLLIKCDEPCFVIAIENKVDSGPGNPFDNYEAAVRDSFPEHPSVFVYLTPVGDELDEDNWTHYSYGDIYHLLVRVRNAHASAIGDDVLAFLNHYLRLIGSRFMDDPKIDELCQTIYKNHRQALQIIWDRAGTPAAGLVGAIEEYLLSKPETWHVIGRRSKGVDFVQKSWLDVLPPIRKSSAKDARTWLKWSIECGAKRCWIGFEIVNTTDPSIRFAVVSRLTQDGNEFKCGQPWLNESTRWNRIAREDVARWKEGDEPPPEALMPKIETMLSKWMNRFQKVPEAIRPIVDDTS